MADTTLTLSTMAAFGTNVNLTEVAAVIDTVNGTEVFAMTPTKVGNKIVIGLINNPAVEAGTLSYSVDAGDLWAAGATTGTVAHGKTAIVQIETARSIKSDGVIKITLTPATGKKLKTDHAAKMFAIECV